MNIRSNAFSFPLQNVASHSFLHDVHAYSLWIRDIPPSRSDVYSATAILIRHGAGAKGRSEFMIVMIDYFGRAAWTIRGFLTWKLLISLLFIVLSSLFIILTTNTNNQNTSISTSGSVEQKELLFSYFLLCAVQSKIPQIVNFLAIDENVKKKKIHISDTYIVSHSVKQIVLLSWLKFWIMSIVSE